MKKDTKKSKLEQASVLIESLFQNSSTPLSHQFLRWKLWRQWPEVVGKNIANNTDPVGYDKGVLIVWVKNASWMQELTFMSKDLIVKVNEHVGKKWIRYIKFTLDRKSVPKLEESDREMRDFLSK